MGLLEGALPMVRGMCRCSLIKSVTGTMNCSRESFDEPFDIYKNDLSASAQDSVYYLQP
jgi:hypothetical protein